MKLSECKRSFALVTGATAGLGLAFAEALAERGLNLVLVARDQERLQASRAALEARYGIEVRVLSADLRQRSAPVQIEAALAADGIAPRVLCNVVGSGYAGELASMSIDEIQDLMSLNTTSMVTLCRLFAPLLCSHRTSAIINVSSVAAIQPMPHMAVYAATKAFVQSFSQALHWELQPRGCCVQTLMPGSMDTDFNRRMGIDRTKIGGMVSPIEVVRRSLAALEQDEIVVAVAPRVWLQRTFAFLFPIAVVLKTVANLVRGWTIKPVEPKATEEAAPPTPAGDDASGIRRVRRDERG